jgi:exosortase/archaeosortase family protein
MLRYLILVIIAFPNLIIFYFVFTPLTVYPVLWVLEALYDAVLFPGNVIFFKNLYASIIPACVAGAAYYLLLVLNLTTPMPAKTRVRNLIYLFAAFLVLNIIRIIIFAILITRGYQYFDIAHLTAWYFGSTVLVILIWFSSVVTFKIKSIPLVTDIKTISKDLKLKRKHN